MNLAASVVRAFWIIGAVASCGLAVSSLWLAPYMARSSQLPVSVIRDGILGMSVVFFLQWPTTAYNAITQGSQREDVVSLTFGLTSTLRALLTWAGLHLAGATLPVFFAAQAIGAGAGTLLSRGFALRLQPTFRSTPASAASIFAERSFLFGVTAMNLSTIGLTQVDKAVLFAFVPLAQYSAYMLAVSGAGAFLLLAAPIYGTVFPQLASLCANPVEEEQAYLRASSVVAIIVWPVGLTGVVFGPELLRTWLSDPEIAGQVAPAFQLLLLGFTLNLTCMVPHALLMARGRTRLATVSNSVASLLAIPSIVLFAPTYGPVVAAFWWLGVTSWLAFGFVPFFHHVIGLRCTGRWLYRALLRPLAICACAALTVHSMTAHGLHPWAAIVLSVSVSALAIALLSAPEISTGPRQLRPLR